MRHRSSGCAVLISVAALSAFVSEAHAQFPPDSFTNLRVLPRDIPARELVQMMAGFTRALGVRCTYCHAGQESQPLETYDFASDEKLPKRKARTMIEMVHRINDEVLVGLESRVDPPVHVECATCHRGVRAPRMLQDILLAAYAAGGLDSLTSTYDRLRERWYGRFAYDFGEVALSDVAGEIGRDPSHAADAERVFALNVEMNPSSAFAKREHAMAALFIAFSAGEASGRARLAGLEAAYGEAAVSEGQLNRLGYDLLGRAGPAPAVAVLRLNAERHPDSANAWDSLGEALAASGAAAEAIRAYERSLELNPSNTNARDRLRRLRGG